MTEVTDPRHWYNQPACLKDGKSLLRASVGHVSVQVIVVGNIYYVTGGDLFNSQTVKVKDANDAFLALDVLSRVARKNSPLPVEKYQWELMENDDETSSS